MRGIVLPQQFTKLLYNIFFSLLSLPGSASSDVWDETRFFKLEMPVSASQDRLITLAVMVITTVALLGYAKLRYGPLRIHDELAILPKNSVTSNLPGSTQISNP